MKINMLSTSVILDSRGEQGSLIEQNSQIEQTGNDVKGEEKHSNESRKTTQMIVILIDNECISLNSLSNNESMNCLYILYFLHYFLFSFR